MDIPLSSDALDLTFHPDESTNLVAVGLISGKIQLIDYTDFLTAPSTSLTPPAKKSKHTASFTKEVGDEERVKLYRKRWVSRPSKKSCRGLHFSSTGETIYSISKDKSLFSTDTATGKVVNSWVGVHGAAPSRVLPVEEMVVTGDDDGVVRLWDPRKGGGVGVKPVRSWEHHFDWITDMVYLADLPVQKPNRAKGEGRKSKSQLKKDRKRARQAEALKQQSRTNNPESSDDDSDSSDEEGRPGPSRSRLIVTSGDGSLSSIDLTSSGPTSFEQSEDQEDELLSITSIRSSSKLVVGTQLGILSLWSPSRGLLDHVDRVPGHPASVDTLVTLDSETVLTGSSDGLVRVVQILPSKLLGVIASHDGLPVERMRRKGSVLGSVGHSNLVKLTDLRPLLEDDEEEGEEGALGIVGLDGDDSDDDEEDEEEGEDDFAGLQTVEDDDEGDEEEDEEDEEDEDDAEEEQEDDSDDDDVPSKKAKGAGFFSDL